MSTTESKLRADFEAHLDKMIQDHEPAFNRYSAGDYVSSEVQMHWQTWQAALALAASSGAEPQVADLWYLQDSRSFIGNDMSWWALGGSGYTTDLRRAQTYSREDVFRKAAMRGCDRAWPKAYIDGKSRPAVDFQHVDHATALAQAEAAKGATP